MRRCLSLFIVALAPLALMECSDATGVFSDATVSMQDQCDPATFNAALGAGSCVRQGSMTLSQFNAELAANHSVAAWQFVPNALTVRVGQSIQVMNNGGEMHTFTHVAQFGGGKVPALNTASGNLVEAPECAALPTNALVASGSTFTTNAETDAGTALYQCCIHLWMRATVTVASP
jgi:plastocyanin